MSESQYRKAVLPNGITLVAERHSHVKAVAIGVWIRVGSAYETPSNNGVSHFIEHLLFKGTEKRTAVQIATVLESLGGDLNAFTDREATCYHATILKEHIDVALDVLSDLVCHPTFPEGEIERERKVLLQELSMVEETPDDFIADLFFRAIWKDKPLGRTIIGTRETIKGLSRSKIIKFFKEHYVPSNMTISVAGDVDFYELKSKCERFFDYPATPVKIRKKVSPSRFSAGRVAKASNTEQLHLLLGFEGVGFQDAFRFDALILSFFLGGGMSSRLFQEIREKAGLAYTVDCDYIPFTETGVFTIYSAMHPKSFAQCMEIIRREIQRLVKEPLKPEDLDLVKGQLRGTILMSSDSMDTRQESLGRNELVFGRYIPVEEVIGEIERVTPDRIQKVAQHLFQKKKEAIVTLSRKKPKLEGLSVLNL